MALPRSVISVSTELLSQPRMLDPAADWYTVIVTRSSDLAMSKTMPATLLPIWEVICEQVRSVAAQYCPARAYWSYSVLVLGWPGVVIIELMPDVAISGVGVLGRQTLFTSPAKPEPALHSPTRLPMSPTRGTLQIPASSAPGLISAVSWYCATCAVCPVTS